MLAHKLVPSKQFLALATSKLCVGFLGNIPTHFLVGTNRRFLRRYRIATQRYIEFLQPIWRRLRIFDFRKRFPSGDTSFSGVVFRARGLCLMIVIVKVYLVKVDNNKVELFAHSGRVNTYMYDDRVDISM